ncbi:MAG: LuxR C-terminal-related transcriptional regulator [Actinomycetota bacterium]
MALRVLIADPEPFFGEALSVALSDGMEVVGHTTDELEAVKLASAHAPDVVLSEVGLAAGSGLSLIRRLGDGVRTIVLTRGHEGDVLLDAVAAGAQGCLGHHLEPSQLLPFLERAADDQFVVEDGRLHEILKRASGGRGPTMPGAPWLGRLTTREREVLQLLARGLDNRAIARQLHLSPHTARTHVGNILRKLGVHSRADAAWVALQEHLSHADANVLRIHGPDLGTD